MQLLLETLGNIEAKLGKLKRFMGVMGLSIKVRVCECAHTYACKLTLCDGLRSVNTRKRAGPLCSQLHAVLPRIALASLCLVPLHSSISVTVWQPPSCFPASQLSFLSLPTSVLTVDQFPVASGAGTSAHRVTVPLLLCTSSCASLLWFPPLLLVAPAAPALFQPFQGRCDVRSAQTRSSA